MREALTYCIDFEWANRYLYHGLYQRTGSYFEGSELSALERPAERRREGAAGALPRCRASRRDGRHLASRRSRDGSGRTARRCAPRSKLLTEAGYKRNGNALVKADTGKPLAFEILLKAVEDEKLALALQRTCAFLGSEGRRAPRRAAQYEVRIKDFDYDMIRFTYTVVAVAGQRAEHPLVLGRGAQAGGTFNFAGAPTRPSTP